jgi:protein phosphatase
MLICPQCQFENPDQHKFCQKCGISLTHKSCLQCDNKVELSRYQCDSCGANTGQTWRAIIICSPEENTAGKLQEEKAKLMGAVAGEYDQEESALDLINSAPQSVFENNNFASNTTENIDEVSPDIAINLGEDSYGEDRYNQSEITCDDPGELLTGEADVKIDVNPNLATNLDHTLDHDIDTPVLSQLTEIPAGEFLDSDQRYQLIDALPACNYGEIRTAIVLDRQPLQVSLLRATMAQTAGGNSLATEDLSKLLIPLVSEEGIDLTLPYLQLKNALPDNIPDIQDSWQNAEKTILLVENLATWPTLSELWSNPDIPQQQILVWLEEMTNLWEKLSVSGYATSLLKVDNLRVHPQILQVTDLARLSAVKIQQLYPDQEKLDFSVLLQFWLWLFEQSQRTLFGPLADFLHTIRAGNLQDIEVVRSLINETRQQILLELGSIDNQSDAENSLPKLQLQSLMAAGATDVGKIRQHNEDYFGMATVLREIVSPTDQVLSGQGLYILCDGMGGHEQGEVASQLTVETLQANLEFFWDEQILPDQAKIITAIHQTNQTIYEINQTETRSGSGRMGTTLVMLLVNQTEVAIAHVGDSRCYRFTASIGLEQLTLDHEVGQREINRGVDEKVAYNRADAYQLTQAIGPRDQQFVQPDIKFLSVEENTLFLLASDGLTDNNLVENNYHAILQPLLHHRFTLPEATEQLIDLANQLNGHDNISVILVRILVNTP